MSWISVVATVVALGFVVLVALQFWMVRRMQALRGQPAPELDGPAGKLVRAGKRALFYFHSPQCGACRAMTPAVRELGKHDARVFSIDVSRDMATAQRFGVMATPTTILVREGRIAEVVIGPRDAGALRGMLEA